MGNKGGKDKHSLSNLNSEIQNGFQSILKCPSPSDLIQRLRQLLSSKYDHADWVGSLSTQEIRQYYSESSENVEQILLFSIETLFETASKSSDVSAEQVNILNNCLRLVTKVIPVLFENSVKSDNFLWKVEDLNYSTRYMQNKKNTLKIYRSNDEEICQKVENQMSIAVKLISSLQKLSYHPAFTILPSADLGTSKLKDFQEIMGARISKESRMGEQIDNSKLWTNLVFKPSLLSTGPMQHPNYISIYDESRMLVLSAILACCSSSLFVPCYGKNYVNPWLTYLTSPINKENGQFFFNLLFYSLSFRARTVNRINQRVQKQIVLISSQIIYAILSHQPKLEQLRELLEANVGLQAINEHLSMQIEEDDDNKIEQSTILSNGILKYLREINSPDAFQIEVSAHLLRLLEEPMETENSLFMDSLKEIGNSEENFGILQQLLYTCPMIYNYVCINPPLLKRLFKVTIYQFCKSLDEASHNNTYYISLSLLTIMSNNPQFNEVLNTKKDFNMNLRNFPIVDGTLADVLISSCAQAIINNRFHNTLCHPFNLMSIIKNISPYVKKLSRATCQKLNQLVIVFTDMDFLLQTEYSPLCIVKLLEAYDHILSKNFIDNISLVFEIYQRNEIFTRIPKINFRESTLRAYFKLLQNQQNASSSVIPNESQKENQSGQQQQQINPDIEQGSKKENEEIKEVAEKDKEELEMSSSSINGQKKRPKRVTKGKKGVTLNDAGNEGESASLQQSESARKRALVQQELAENRQEETINVQIKNSSLIKERSPEDIFVDRWKNYDWPSIFKSIPLSNLAIVIKSMNEFVNQSLKKSRYELKFETLVSEKHFVSCLKEKMTQGLPILSEHFSNDDDILIFAQQCCWMQVLVKQILFPTFEPSVVLYFRSDLQPISLRSSIQQIGPGLTDSNVFTENQQK